MKRLEVSVSIVFGWSPLDTGADLERRYQDVYRKAATFFYQHQHNRASVFFPGPLLRWLDEEHPEFTRLFAKMVDRRQIEILGGGFHEPLFPLLPPVDRSGQLELLTSEIRRVFGKRPRGAVIHLSAWDNSMVSTLSNGGIEYVLLSSSLIPERSPYRPYILNERGKTVKALFFRSLDGAGPEPADLLSLLSDESSGSLPGLFPDDGIPSRSRMVSLCVSEDRLQSLLDSVWLEKFYFMSRTSFSDRIDVSLPTEFLPQGHPFEPIFVRPGIDSGVGGTTVFDLLYSSPAELSLYNRMLHVETLLSQCRGDKARRDCARETLWAAQHHSAFIRRNGAAGSRLRQSAFMLMCEAERASREVGGFSESAASFDYDGDGRDDFVFSMGAFSAVVSPAGAGVVELDVMRGGRNYADGSLPCGLLSSRLLSDSELSIYRNSSDPLSLSSIGSAISFRESSFFPQKKEVRLVGFGRTDCGGAGVPISLVKRFCANSNGFTVQFILRNEGDSRVRGNLLVESRFPEMDAGECHYRVDTVCAGGSSSSAVSGPVSVSGVSFVQVTDASSEVSFAYEPNESCDSLFLRTSGRDGPGLLSALFWPVDLEAGLEMEKTVNFSVIAPKRRKR